MTKKPKKEGSAKKAKAKTVFEFSAGGVVVRAGEVLLIWARDLKGASVVTLPKGLVNHKESSEQAALREVREETGYRCRVVKELPKSEYFYRRGDKLVRKTVRWFLMEPVEKEGEHDHEIDDARWLPIKEALSTLSYDSDRKLVETVEGGG